MNQLSKEAIEAIEETNCFANEQKSDAYRQGATEALTNPEIFEKAGLIKVSEVDGFIQWRNLNYFYSDMGKGWLPFGQDSLLVYTTAQLFQIYKQQTL